MKVALLLSGVGFGTYVPGVYCAEQLAKTISNSRCFVIESFYSEDHIRRLVAFRNAIRTSPALARVASSSIGITRPKLDENELENLVGSLAEYDADVLLSFSGFWSPVVAEFVRRLQNRKPLVVRCHVDAIESPSWRDNTTIDKCLDLWACSAFEERACYRVEHAAMLGYPRSLCSRKIVLHGGGWGLGHWDQHAVLLAAAHWKVQYITPHPPSDLSAEFLEIYQRCEGWEAWDSSATQTSSLPPMEKVQKAGSPMITHLREALMDASAIVSKPGGGTLFDSLASAVPIVMLPPFGDHEVANGKLWAKLGFGIWWEDWRANGFSNYQVDKAREQLLKSLPSIPLFEEVFRESYFRLLPA